MSKSIPIIKNFSHNPEDYIGQADLSDFAVKNIEDMLKSGQIFDVVVSFIGEPDEDGTYRDVKLIGFSTVPRVAEDNG